MPDKQVTDSKETAEESVQEVTKVIPAKELEKPQIRTWHLNNLEKEVEQKALEREQKVYDDLKQKMQPEIQRQTEILKKEAYELAKQEGFDAGYAEGKVLGEQEGKEIALVEAEETLAPKIEQLNALLESLDKPYKLLEKKVFESLSNLALNIAEEVIQQKIGDNPDWVMKIIRESVSALNDSLSPIEIFLNPKDFDLISEQSTNFAENWNVQSSDAVEVGTCKIKQDFSSIEHNWKHRFESMSVKLQAQAVADADKPDSDAG
ncbi:FliH/SctL family protein [Thiomicrorhabdus sp. ZW0627]|uniref:FliH/SctL family protein n=1 Tax=Thiomicrorhabdus sp. ZW0627 TaxID=3039774 RepID=UPI002436AFE3|nr:FliH/SctL family protein [Thiomicrorhabdus sp. ZW0627]MDG6773344.1 FliH/SctL family protein [Thiomicrorhabdus sp. ZW0627]